MFKKIVIGLAITTAAIPLLLTPNATLATTASLTQDSEVRALLQQLIALLTQRVQELMQQLVAQQQSSNSNTLASSSSTPSVISQHVGAPIVQAFQVVNAQQTSVSLNGKIDPNGADATYCFEYGTVLNLNPGSCTSQQSVRATAGEQLVSTSIDVSPNTTYYFRIDALNQYGSTQGQVLSFATPGAPPIVVTEKNFNLNGAGGSVNPNNAATTYWFEYGATQNLGSETPHQLAGPTGLNSIEATFSTLAPSLQSNTTYYFRIVAQNQYGISRGEILNFIYTSPCNTGSRGIIPCTVHA